MRWLTPSELDRFLSFVNFETDGCWLWEGTTTTGGYGVLRFPGVRSKFVHRHAYEWFVGAIPEGYTIDHLCRVTCCVNPEHLEAVPGRVNTLRGFGPTAINARKTHCPRGHLLSADNLIPSHPSRSCLSCRREKMRGYRASYKARKQQSA